MGDVMPRISANLLRGASDGFSRGAQGFMSGDAAYRDGFDKEAQLQTKLAQALAQTRSADAAARYHDAQAGEASAKTDVLKGRPGLFEEQVAAASGSDIPLVQSVRRALAGNPDRYDMGPSEQDGTMAAVPIDPKKYSAVARSIQQFLPLLTNTGDLKPDDLSKAAGDYRNMGLSDAIIAGTMDRNKVGGAQAAVAGKDLYNRDTTGSVLDQFTGSLDTSNPLAQSTIGLRGAQAGEARAGAAERNAGADEKRARTDQIRQEIQQGGKTGQTQIVTDANGNVTLVDKMTGQARPAIGPDGKPLQGKGGDLNEGQANALAFATRMDAADKILGDMASLGVRTPGAIKLGANGIPSWAGGGLLQSGANFIQSPQQQQVEQAQRDFINAVLRRESGAAISSGEFSNAAQQYFPQPGDSPAVIKQKAAARRRGIEMMLQAVPASRRPSLGGSRTVQVDY